MLTAEMSSDLTRGLVPGFTSCLQTRDPLLEKRQSLTCVGVYVRMYMHMHVYICMCIYLCLFTYLHMHVYFLSLPPSLSPSLPPFLPSSPSLPLSLPPSLPSSLRLPPSLPPPLSLFLFLSALAKPTCVHKRCLCTSAKCQRMIARHTADYIAVNLLQHCPRARKQIARVWCCSRCFAVSSPPHKRARMKRLPCTSCGRLQWGLRGAQNGITM